VTGDQDLPVVQELRVGKIPAVNIDPTTLNVPELGSYSSADASTPPGWSLRALAPTVVQKADPLPSRMTKWRLGARKEARRVVRAESAEP